MRMILYHKNLKKLINTLISPAEKPPTVGLLIFWSVTSLLAYTIAGEKMPWLTVHITLPMILLSGWSFGYLIDTTDWNIFRTKKGWLTGRSCS